MAALERMEVFGIPYVAASLEDACAFWAETAATTDRAQLTAHSDVHVLTRILGDEEYGAGVRGFDFICPDGMPIVWLMRRKGADAHRLYGPDVMEMMWDKGRSAHLRHFRRHSGGVFRRGVCPQRPCIKTGGAPGQLRGRVRQ